MPKGRLRRGSIRWEVRAVPSTSFSASRLGCTDTSYLLETSRTGSGGLRPLVEYAATTRGTPKPKHRRKSEAKKSPKLRHIPTSHVGSARHVWRYKRHIQRHIQPKKSLLGECFYRQALGFGNASYMKTGSWWKETNGFLCYRAVLVLITHQKFYTPRFLYNLTEVEYCGIIGNCELIPVLQPNFTLTQKVDVV